MAVRNQGKIRAAVGCYSGVSLEVNLSPGIALVAGAGYRFVSGIDSGNEYVDITHLTSQDMSGVNLSAGLKITKSGKK